MNAIETIALNKSFRRVQAVRDLHLVIPVGSFYALMGPNGAGKTTLIKLLMNLLPATSGQASMLGHDAAELHGPQLEQIGYVSENQKLPDWMSVGAFLRYWRPFYPAWDLEFEKQLVHRFNLPLNQKLKHLSRGMRMKLSLTSVLSYRPKLLILDEPLSGLDPLVRDDLMESLLERPGETTVLMSSHDLAEIDSFSTHVGYMGAGRLQFSETMPALRRRFCRVAISAGSPLSTLSKPPVEWLQFSSKGATAQWVEADYDAAASPARVQRLFGEVHFAASPMTLREIFLTMARTSSVQDSKAA